MCGYAWRRMAFVLYTPGKQKAHELLCIVWEGFNDNQHTIIRIKFILGPTPRSHSVAHTDNRLLSRDRRFLKGAFVHKRSLYLVHMMRLGTELLRKVTNNH